MVFVVERIMVPPRCPGPNLQELVNMLPYMAKGTWKM